MLSARRFKPKLARVAPEIPVTNMDESLIHYTTKLGFEVEMKMPAGDYVIVTRDNVALHLFQDRAKRHSPISLHIFTSGLEELFAELHDRGAQVSQRIVRQPWGNRDFRITDSSGNEIKFTELLSEEA
jgi:uncharacterized glyoxalase superfamily protein PhnB